MSAAACSQVDDWESWPVAADDPEVPCTGWRTRCANVALWRAVFTPARHGCAGCDVSVLACAMCRDRFDDHERAHRGPWVCRTCGKAKLFVKWAPLR